MALIRACGRTRACAYRSRTAWHAAGVGRGPDDESSSYPDVAEWTGYFLHARATDALAVMAPRDGRA
jgi:hypothetical protein